MFYYVQGLFHVALEILCCKLFYETFGEKRAENAKWKNSAIVLSLIVIVYVIADLFHSHFLAKQVLIIGFTAVLMRYYLNISLLKSVILSALYQGFLLVVDYFTMLLNVTILHSMTEIEAP